MMTSKERFLAALEGNIPDRLPVTTHHIQPYFLNKYMNGMSIDGFFDHFGLDPILWLVPHKPDESKGHYYDPTQGEPGFLEYRRICSDEWRIECEDIPDPEYKTTRFKFVTPKKTLTEVLQAAEHTTWVTERMIKEKSDIDIIAQYAPAPLCDTDEVNCQAEQYGSRGLVRGMIPGFDVYGQSGCWQDAAVLFGIEDLIMQTFHDPEWVHTFLKTLFRRKVPFLKTCHGAKFDILEHGGGDASSSVISPNIFDTFVAPYDAELTDLAHQAGQRVVYHTCGGMMPILENIVAIHPDAMETFTPHSMGGDTDLVEAKNRVGDKVCMIGGFDQYYRFNNCTEAETRQTVRECFDAAGEGGGFILAPSDHFFDAEPKLIKAFADEARSCTYN